MSDTHAVPETLEFQRGAGAFDNQVYECQVCNERITGTENAARHTGCSLAPACPTCGQRDQGWVDVGPGLRRVEYCPRCQQAFLPGVP